MQEEIEKLIWKKMDELRSSNHFSDYNRFSSTSTLQRIGKEIGLEQLKKVISNKELVQTANSPKQVIPVFLYDFIKIFVNKIIK